MKIFVYILISSFALLVIAALTYDKTVTPLYKFIKHKLIPTATSKNSKTILLLSSITLLCVLWYNSPVSIIEKIAYSTAIITISIVSLSIIFPIIPIVIFVLSLLFIIIRFYKQHIINLKSITLYVSPYVLWYALLFVHNSNFGAGNISVELSSLMFVYVVTLILSLIVSFYNISTTIKFLQFSIYIYYFWVIAMRLSIPKIIYK